MPYEGTQFKGKLVALQAQRVDGQFAYQESAVQRHPYASYAFAICTGGSNGLVPDVAYNQSAPVTLIPASAVPANMRPYVTRFDVDIQGPTAWAGGTAVILEDTNGSPLVYLPANCLRGLANYTFPDSDTDIPALLAVASYNSGTGVITFANASTPYANLVTGTALQNTPFTVVAGTGIGQSGLISSYTGGNGSTLTPVNGAAALATPLDSTSVVAVWYWQATGGSTTTAVFSNAFFTSNALDNGFNLVSIVTANAAGGVRPIISNTGTTPTIPSAQPFAGAVASGDLLQICNENNLFGALDLAVGDKWSAAQTNAGLQIATLGTFTAGSNLRCYVEGYFAY
jgi:hypothetical protein